MIFNRRFCFNYSRLAMPMPKWRSQKSLSFKRFARGWFSKFMIFTPTWRNDRNFDQQIFQRFCVVQTPTRELSSFWRGFHRKSQNSEILWPLHCQVNWSLVLYISFVWTKMALARRISSQHMAPWCGSRDLIKSTTRKGLRLSYCCMCLYIFKYQYTSINIQSMICKYQCMRNYNQLHTWMWICSKYF